MTSEAEGGRCLPTPICCSLLLALWQDLWGLGVVLRSQVVAGKRNCVHGVCGNRELRQHDYEEEDADDDFAGILALGHDGCHNSKSFKCRVSFAGFRVSGWCGVVGQHNTNEKIDIPLAPLHGFLTAKMHISFGQQVRQATYIQPLNIVL